MNAQKKERIRQNTKQRPPVKHPSEVRTESKLQHELLLKLLRQNSEKDINDIVVNFIKENPTLEVTWENYGRVDGNWATIGNQQASSDTALTEKLTNSQDAILINEAYARGLDPKSGVGTPKTVKEASLLWFTDNDGIKIKVYASDNGNKKALQPSITIADIGTGQPPSLFETTFLSLGLANKQNIPFVQGKFNMGSTGVIPFCGKEGIQIICSKASDEYVNFLTEQDPKTAESLDLDKWGFTLIKRFKPADNEKSSSVKYLMINGKTPRFDAESIELHGDVYTHGTIVKLLEYELKTQSNHSLRADISTTLSTRMKMLLPDPVVPITFKETRDYGEGDHERTVFGLKPTFYNNDTNLIEAGFPVTATFKYNGAPIDVEVFAFSKLEDTFKHENLIYVLNGQTHNIVSNSFFNRKNVGLNILSDSLFMVVDCSKMHNADIEDMFKSSRDRLSNSDVSRFVESELIKIVTTSETINDLRERRVKEKYSNEGNKLNSTVMEHINKYFSDFNFAGNMGDALTKPAAEKEKFELRTDLLEYPTFFRSVRESTPETPIKVHLNSRTRLRYETDVRNDYFTRAENNGVIEVGLEPLVKTDVLVSTKLENGKLTVELLFTDKKFKVGQAYKVIVSISDKHGFTYYDTIYVTMLGERVTREPEEREKSKPKDNFKLPKIERVTKEEWGEHINEDTGIYLEVLGMNEYIFKINMDNKYFVRDKGKLVGNNTEQAIVIDNFFMEYMSIHGIIAFLDIEASASAEVQSENGEAMPTKASVDEGAVQADFNTYMSTIAKTAIVSKSIADNAPKFAM